MRLFLAMLATAFLFPFAAQATTCNPRFVDNAQTVTISGIRVANHGTATSEFQVRVRNDGNGACTSTLRIARLSTTLPDNWLPLTLRSGGTVLQILSSNKLASTPASDLTIPGIPGGSGGRAIPFMVGIGTEWGVASGFYSEQFQLSLIDSTGAVTDTMLLTIQFNVPPAVALRIVGVTGNNEIATINLGTLKPQSLNQSDPFGLRVWSTSPYSVSFLSANAGYLRRTDGTDRIPYKLLMSGQQVDVVGATPISFGHRTQALGELHPLAVTVDPFDARAGDYSDRVTVTVTAY